MGRARNPRGPAVPGQGKPPIIEQFAELREREIYTPLTESDILAREEREDLVLCEKAIDSLRLAFWAAGKALQLVRDARLYRAEHRTFEEYCEKRWQLSRAYADRLIRAWPVAEVVFSVNGGETSVNEAQARELTALHHQHGDEATALVYSTVAEVNDGKVTATALREAVAAVKGEFDPKTAADQIRAYLTRDADDVDTDQPVPWETRFQRIRSTVTRVDTEDFIAAARTDREKALGDLTEAAAVLQRVIDAVKAE